MAISTQGKYLFSSALSLPPAERMELAEQLWASVEEDWSPESADPDWRAVWNAEIQQRISDVETGTSQLIDGEMVMRELRERLSR